MSRADPGKVLNREPLPFHEKAAEVERINPTIKIPIATPAPVVTKRGVKPNSKNPSVNLPSPGSIISSLTVF